VDRDAGRLSGFNQLEADGAAPRAFYVLGGVTGIAYGPRWPASRSVGHMIDASERLVTIRLMAEGDVAKTYNPDRLRAAADGTAFRIVPVRGLGGFSRPTSDISDAGRCQVRWSPAKLGLLAPGLPAGHDRTDG